MEKAAPPLVAAVAAETPLRKWRIGHTLIQFTINKTLLEAGSKKHVALPYVALFRYAALPPGCVRPRFAVQLPSTIGDQRPRDEAIARSTCTNTECKIATRISMWKRLHLRSVARISMSAEESLLKPFIGKSEL